MTARRIGEALAVAALLLTACSCARGGSDGAAESGARQTALLPVTVSGAGGSHTFRVERAVTSAEQERGLMFRTDLKPDGGMLFWPYPAGGGAARDASFWMKNTPTPLDIVFIRGDGTIARIAENAVPFSETPLVSGEPVTAVLELVGGRTAELGIAEGDRVSWPK